jgi:hypothetical protein
MTKPVVKGINPATGSTAGGTLISIFGSNFTGATGVSFGGTAAQSFTVQSDSQVNAVSPGHNAGAADVQVTNADGTSSTSPADQFIYVLAVPQVTSVVPNKGPAAGGTQVVISGSNLNVANGVNFGTTGANYTINSNTQITATSPAHAAGTVDVVVTSPNGNSNITQADQFEYQAFSYDPTRLS